jgi:hypothetical protein
LVKIDDVIKTRTTPHHHEIRPQFISAEFPEEFESGQNGYRLKHVMFGEQRLTSGAFDQIYVDSDTVITAEYQKMVRVQAENALGSGHYPHGTPVVLSVPPKDRVLFFVRDVFDHWEGIPYDSDTVTLLATENIDAKAVLREDYSILMLTCGLVLTAVVYFRFVWGRGISTYWYVRKLSDALLIPKIRPFFHSKMEGIGKRREKPRPDDRVGIDF